MQEPIGQYEGLNIYDKAPSVEAAKKRLKRNRIDAPLYYCLIRVRTMDLERSYWIRKMCYPIGDNVYQEMHERTDGRVQVASYSYFRLGEDGAVLGEPVDGSASVETGTGSFSSKEGE